MKLFVIIFCICGGIGLLRTGNELSLYGITENIFLESFYTAYSLIYYLSNYQLKLINSPRVLVSSLWNLVPSMICDNKAEKIISYEDVGISIYSPLGAMNSYVSFQVNFGVIGTIIFVFVGSIMLKKLYEAKNDRNSKVIYSLISSNLAFTFFRDPFSVSLIKNIFEFSIVIPVLLLIGSTIIQGGKIKCIVKG